MELLSEFFDTIPIGALTLVVFGLALLWIFSRYFSMPASFKIKEEYRDEVRFRLFSDNENSAAKAKAEAEAAAAEKEANEAAAEKENVTDVAANSKEGAPNTAPAAAAKKT